MGEVADGLGAGAMHEQSACELILPEVALEGFRLPHGQHRDVAQRNSDTHFRSRWENEDNRSSELSSCDTTRRSPSRDRRWMNCGM